MEDKDNSNKQHSIVLYQSSEANVCVNVYYCNETFWLTQKAIAELFGVNPQAITKHLGNIYEDNELEKEATCSKMEQVQQEGARTVKRMVDFYNLDAIIAVGYRVNSKQATAFRIWATKTLREYITKGFVLNDDMLKNGRPFGKDYFDELLERIREIRASERRAYQKIADVFEQCSYDYDKNSETTKAFYSFVQNKLHYAVTGQTAAELIYSRADATQPTMGLTTWGASPDGKILKRDVTVAKNYLNEKERFRQAESRGKACFHYAEARKRLNLFELSRLNRLVTMFIDYAELMAEDNVLMSMQDWLKQTDVFLNNNRREVLADKGTVSHDQAVAKATQEYEIFRVRQDQEYVSEFDKEMEKYLKGNND